ncbi:MAG: cobalamin synthesis protein P47K [Acidobacteria bacterium]|nr:cobalamin synthesis protein P47K [Acidobacteriota bacterium]
MPAARLILIGGFLGSGKTTLLQQLARRLSLRGRTVGTIVNDQAPGLVDTALLHGCGCCVKEVAGSCFCCDFRAFEEAVQSLIGLGAEIVLAEPVGSCTDLAATILQPLKDLRPDIEVAPFTVLVSPEHVREALGESESEMHPGTLYILRMQIAEADRLLLNKIDLLSAPERADLTGLLRGSFPGREVGEISARSGDGIDVWMADLDAGGDAGAHIVEVNYDRYAEGEAALGWLNAIVRLEATGPEADFFPPAMEMMERLHRAFREHGAPVGHVKALIESGGEQRAANLTDLDGGIVTMDQTPLRGARATLILNARVQMPAGILETVARSAIHGICGRAVRTPATEFRCLTPARPEPTYRYRAPGSSGCAGGPQ